MASGYRREVLRTLSASAKGCCFSCTLLNVGEPIRIEVAVCQLGYEARPLNLLT